MFFDNDLIDNEISSEQILKFFEAEIEPMQKSERTRLRIMASAARVFSAKGYQETSIQDIADDAGIAKGTIYYYVDKKEDLIVLLFELGQKLMFSKIENGLKEHETALDKLVFMLSTHLIIMRTVLPVLPIFIHNLLSHDERITNLILRFRGSYLDVLTSIIKEGKETGEFKLEDEEEIAYAVLSLVLGQTLQQKVLFDKIDANQIIQTTLNIAIRGAVNDSQS
ncbi:MAG: TetR/AcrR family transcriptional regulator [Rubrobacteridae bacterium]|nr:TetR/AcrR family transcriptional regulator [Rubrobacteridae bacterium]